MSKKLISIMLGITLICPSMLWAWTEEFGILRTRAYKERQSTYEQKRELMQVIETELLTTKDPRKFEPGIKTILRYVEKEGVIGLRNLGLRIILNLQIRRPSMFSEKPSTDIVRVSRERVEYFRWHQNWEERHEAEVALDLMARLDRKPEDIELLSQVLGLYEPPSLYGRNRIKTKAFVAILAILERANIDLSYLKGRIQEPNFLALVSQTEQFLNRETPPENPLLWAALNLPYKQETLVLFNIACGVRTDSISPLTSSNFEREGLLKKLLSIAQQHEENITVIEAIHNIRIILLSDKNLFDKYSNEFQDILFYLLGHRNTIVCLESAKCLLDIGLFDEETIDVISKLVKRVSKDRRTKDNRVIQRLVREVTELLDIAKGQIEIREPTVKPGKKAEAKREELPKGRHSLNEIERIIIEAIDKGVPADILQRWWQEQLSLLVSGQKIGRFLAKFGSKIKGIVERLNAYEEKAKAGQTRVEEKIASSILRPRAFREGQDAKEARLVRDIMEGFKAEQGVSISKDMRITLEDIVEFLGVEEARKVFYRKGKLKNYESLYGLFAYSGWYSTTSKGSRKKRSETYLALNEMSKIFGEDAVIALMKKDQRDFRRLLGFYHYQSRSLLRFEDIVYILMSIFGRDVVIEKLRMAEDRWKFFRALDSLLNEGVFSAEAVKGVAQAFGEKDSERLKRILQAAVLERLDRHELECLARECRMTGDFAREFSEKTKRVVVAVGVKSHGAYYAWTMDEPLRQVQMQVGENPRELEAFMRQVEARERRNGDRNLSLLQVAQRWIDRGRLQWFVLPAEAKVPSTALLEDGGESMLAGNLAAMGLLDQYVKLVKKLMPNFLIVDSSHYNQLPESFRYLKKNIERYYVFRDYAFITVAHPSVRTRIFPKVTFAGETKSWRDFVETETDDEEIARREGYEMLVNGTDLKDKRAKGIVSSGFFKRVMENKKGAPLAIGLNPARRVHNGRLHKVAWLDDQRMLDRSPELVRALQEEIRRIDGWYHRNDVTRDRDRDAFNLFLEQI